MVGTIYSLEWERISAVKARRCLSALDGTGVLKTGKNKIASVVNMKMIIIWDQAGASV